MRRRRRQAIIFGVIAGTGFTLIFIVGWIYFQKYRFNTYTHPTAGFSIQYPAQWSFSENKDGAAVVFYSPPESDLDVFRENVNIVIQDLSQNPMTLDKYTETAIYQMQAVFEHNLVILESVPALVSGLPGHKFVFLGKGPETEMQFMVVWTLDGLTTYQVTYTALSPHYEKYLGKINRMFRSFKIQ